MGNAAVVGASTVDASEEFVEIVAGELPLELLGNAFVVASEGVQAFLEGVERSEVIGGEGFALQD